MSNIFKKLGPIFCCFLLTDIMILLVIFQIKIEKNYISLIIFIIGILFYYFSPYNLFKYSVEFSYNVRIYLMSHKLFLFFLGAKAFWNYKDLISIYKFGLSSFIIAIILISIIDFLRTYIYMNLEENLYSELYKSYNVKLLMFDYLIKLNNTLINKKYLGEKERFFLQLKLFKKKRPKLIDYMKLWEEWSDDNTKATSEEINNIVINNKLKNRRASIILNTSSKDINLESKDIFNKLNNEKKGEFITLKTLKNWNKEHAYFIHSFLSNSPNAPIDIERFSEDIKQINNERLSFYKNLHSQERLKRMVHLILILIEFCILLFCFGTMMKISISYITIAAPMFLLCVLPSIMERLSTFFTILFTHPFDCGDRIYMNGKNLIVNNIYLFSIDVSLWNGTNVIIPNSRLAKEPIGNAKRSIYQKGYINILIKNDPEKLNLLINNIKEKAKYNEFIKDVVFKLDGIHDCCNINFQIIFTHIRNFQNGFFMWRRHNSFLLDVKTLMNDMGIIYVPNTFNWKILNDSNKFNNKDNIEEFII